jgi:AraC-like DNA-binding protein
MVLIVPIRPYLDSFRTVLEQQAPTTPVLKKGTWENRAVSEFFHRALEEWKDLCEEEKKGYLLLIFSRLLPLFPCEMRPSIDATAAELALRYLAEHFSEPITRKDLAKALNYTESYLSHLFSQALGTTLTEYLTSLRINEACRLLDQSDTSVSHIALSLGFGSIRSFNRAFRRTTSLSPSEYRCRNQSESNKI